MLNYPNRQPFQQVHNFHSRPINSDLSEPFNQGHFAQKPSVGSRSRMTSLSGKPSSQQRTGILQKRRSHERTSRGGSMNSSQEVSIQSPPTNLSQAALKLQVTSGTLSPEVGVPQSTMVLQDGVLSMPLQQQQQPVMQPVMQQNFMNLKENSDRFSSQVFDHARKQNTPSNIEQQLMNMESMIHNQGGISQEFRNPMRAVRNKRKVAQQHTWQTQDLGTSNDSQFNLNQSQNSGSQNQFLKRNSQQAIQQTSYNSGSGQPLIPDADFRALNNFSAINDNSRNSSSSYNFIINQSRSNGNIEAQQDVFLNDFSQVHSRHQQDLSNISHSQLSEFGRAASSQSNHPPSSSDAQRNASNVFNLTHSNNQNFNNPQNASSYFGGPMASRDHRESSGQLIGNGLAQQQTSSLKKNLPSFSNLRSEESSSKLGKYPLPQPKNRLKKRLDQVKSEIQDLEKSQTPKKQVETFSEFSNKKVEMKANELKNSRNSYVGNTHNQEHVLDSLFNIHQQQQAFVTAQQQNSQVSSDQLFPQSSSANFIPPMGGSSSSQHNGSQSLNTRGGYPILNQSSFNNDNLFHQPPSSSNQEGLFIQGPPQHIPLSGSSGQMYPPVSPSLGNQPPLGHLGPMSHPVSYPEPASHGQFSTNMNMPRQGAVTSINNTIQTQFSHVSNTPHKKSVRIDESYVHQQTPKSKKSAGRSANKRSSRSKPSRIVSNERRSSRPSSAGSRLSQTSHKSILKSSSKKRSEMPSHYQQLPYAPPRYNALNDSQMSGQSIRDSLKNKSASIRKSIISEKNLHAFARHKGYDRQIQPVPIDVIPAASQSSQTFITKHVYPRKYMPNANRNPRSQWSESYNPNENFTFFQNKGPSSIVGSSRYQTRSLKKSSKKKSRAVSVSSKKSSKHLLYSGNHSRRTYSEKSSAKWSHNKSHKSNLSALSKASRKSRVSRKSQISHVSRKSGASRVSKVSITKKPINFIERNILAVSSKNKSGSLFRRDTAKSISSFNRKSLQSFNQMAAKSQKSKLSRSKSATSKLSKVSQKSRASGASRKVRKSTYSTAFKQHKKTILKSPSLQDGCFFTEEKKSRNGNHRTMTQNLVKRKQNHSSLEPNEGKTSISPKILSRSAQLNFTQIKNAKQWEIESKFQKIMDGREKISSQRHSSIRSLSQEYLNRTSKKNLHASNHMSGGGHSPHRHSIDASLLDFQNQQSSFMNRNHTGPISRSRGAPSQDLTSFSNQDAVLTHVMRQINSLKVENLELKKMLSGNMREADNSQNLGRLSNSQKRVSISQYNVENQSLNMLENKSDLYSIPSVTSSSRPSRLQAKHSSQGVSCNSMNMSRSRKMKMANYMKSTKSNDARQSRHSAESARAKSKSSRSRKNKVLYLNNETHNRIISIPLNNLCWQDQKSFKNSSKSRTPCREEVDQMRNSFTKMDSPSSSKGSLYVKKNMKVTMGIQRLKKKRKDKIDGKAFWNQHIPQSHMVRMGAHLVDKFGRITVKGRQLSRVTRDSSQNRGSRASFPNLSMASRRSYSRGKGVEKRKSQHDHSHGLSSCKICMSWIGTKKMQHSR